MASSSLSATDESYSPSPMMDSVSSLSSSYNSQSPNIARTYKQASQLFLTRQIKESLDTLEPVIRRQPASNGLDDNESTNGDSNKSSEPPPIAFASRGARNKVWGLYISILNEVAEMGAEAGKKEFGSARWKALVAKAKDGTCWEEIVQDGYGGNEGTVDADVVSNLATLLLSQAPSQKLTQQRLEAYLAASSAPTLDIASHLARNEQKSAMNGHTNGTSTPRDLNSRLKILEIYVLHVLPRNDEWEYAKEFVNMSEVLDDERREAFVQALQSLEEEKNFDARREAELQKQRDQQLEDARKKDLDEENAKRAAQAKAEEDAKLSAAPSREHDFGIEKSRPAGSQRTGSNAKATSSQTPNGAAPGGAGTESASASSKKPRPPPPGLYRRASHTIAAVQQSLLQMGQTMFRNPRGLIRMFFFLVALIMALARRDVRERVKRASDEAWNKIKATLGMAVKVSYI